MTVSSFIQSSTYYLIITSSGRMFQGSVLANYKAFCQNVSLDHETMIEISETEAPASSAPLQAS